MATGKSYQPYLLTNSAYEADLFDGNTLNTPDIVDMLDTFHGPFPTYSEKEFTNNSVFNDPLYGIFDNSPMLSNTIQNNEFNQMPGNITINNNNNLNNIIRYSPDNIDNMNYCYDRKSYSPLLESSEINLENMSSPEMAPVSPNRVCPQSEYTYQYDSSNGSTTNTSTSSNNNNSNNNPNSNNNNNNITNNNNATYQILENVAPIKSEYDQVTTIVDFLTDGTQPSSHGSTETIITLTSNGSPLTVQNINTNNSNTTSNNNNTNNNFYQQICSPHSPSSISSNYSLDSNNSQHKTFATLDNVQCNIKQEPMDTILQYQSVVPTVVDETIVSSGAFIPATICQTAQQPTQTTNQVIYNITSNTGVNNGTTTSYYYMQPTTTNTVPATELVNSHLINTNTNTLIHNATTSSSTSNTNTSTNVTTPTSGKKRSAGFGPLPGTIGGGQKKQRMSKREKQKLMESYIEKYEKENKDLNNQIKLFEKQIEFCKKYLSENVAPYIQRQQQQQQPIHHTLQSFVGLA